MRTKEESRADDFTVVLSPATVGGNPPGRRQRPGRSVHRLEGIRSHASTSGSGLHEGVRAPTRDPRPGPLGEAARSCLGLHRVCRRGLAGHRHRGHPAARTANRGSLPEGRRPVRRRSASHGRGRHRGGHLAPLSRAAEVDRLLIAAGRRRDGALPFCGRRRQHRSRDDHRGPLLPRWRHPDHGDGHLDVPDASMVRQLANPRRTPPRR